MAQSRVEKFKEYRKNIINGDNDSLKTTIESEIKVSTPIEGSPISEEETIFLKQIYRKERAVVIFYFASVAIIIATLVVFGFILL